MTIDDPSADPETLCDRGVALQNAGRFEEALEFYAGAVALAPGYVDAHYNAGNVLFLLRRLDEALDSLDQAIRLDPRFAWAHVSRGAVLHELGRHGDALISDEAAIALRPDCAPAHANRGANLFALDRRDEALASYDAAIALDPGHVEAHANRGNLLFAERRIDEALASYERAMMLRPAFAEAHFGRGATLHELARFAEALAAYDAALALQPDHAGAWCGRGNALKHLQRYDEAEASFGTASELDPNFAGAHANGSLLRLMRGDFEAGWKAYEWRHKILPPVFDDSGAGSAWSGVEPLAGKTVFIHWEQGLGDTIQFYRYAHKVRDLGARVVLWAPETLVDLLKNQDDGIDVIASGTTPPAFDAHASLMSLPLAFRTDLATIPADIPYLRADRSKAARWRERLGDARRPRVGLVWNGGFRPDQPEVWLANTRRNADFADFARLNLAGIDFYSLQKGAPAETDIPAQRAEHWPQANFHEVAGALADFSDTAALIANLDLVISVDTSTAHLAGAMGKPVWILLPAVPCWRWLLNREDSPWYPTARLFRQVEPDDWTPVISRVKDALAARFP